MAEPLRPGHLVISRAGRDRGQPFVVVGLQGDRFALVADGRGRCVAHPKRKNPRHLLAHGMIEARLAARLAAGEQVSDLEIRDALTVVPGSAGPEDVE